MTCRRPRRKGFTLIETLISCCLATVVIVLIMSTYRMGTLSFHSTRRRLSAVQGALLLEERLSSEIPRALVESSADLSVSADAREMTFTSFEVNGSYSGGTADTYEVAYLFDADTGQFSWTHGGDDGGLPNVDFEHVEFAYPPLAVGSSPLSGPETECVEVRISCASHDDVKRNQGLADDSPRRAHREVMTVFAYVGLHQKASRTSFPYWRDNP